MFGFNDADGVEDRRNNDDAECQRAGNRHSVDAFRKGFGGIAEHTVIHGLINTVSRYEGN